MKYLVFCFWFLIRVYFKVPIETSFLLPGSEIPKSENPMQEENQNEADHIITMVNLSIDEFFHFHFPPAMDS